MEPDSIETRLQAELASIGEEIPRRFMILGGRCGAGNWLPSSRGRTITVEDFEEIIALYKKNVGLVYNLSLVAYQMNMARGDEESEQEAEEIMEKYGRWVH